MCAMNPRLLRPLATGFNPLSIAGLEAWWDFADVSSVTLDSGRVSAVTDKSGNGRTAANSTSGSTQPDYVAAGRNGKNVARFAAASTQRLTVSSSTTAFNFLHNGTLSYVCAVFSTGTTADPNGFFSVIGNNSGTSANVGIDLSVDDRTPFFNMNLRARVFSGGTAPASADKDNALVAQQTHVVEALIDVTNATASDRVLGTVDGAALGMNNTLTGTASASNATNNFQIGACGANTNPHTGDVCEILIFSQQPTLSQRLALRKHLARKWGVTLA